MPIEICQKNIFVCFTGTFYRPTGTWPMGVPETVMKFYTRKKYCFAGSIKNLSKQEYPIMQPVFISHSAKDRSFVNLLTALLEFHGISTWCSTEDIHGSHQYRDEINKALENAGSLIVAVSKNSSESKWVVKEFVQFRTMKPESPVLPLLLDDTDLAQFVDGLESYQAIDFQACMKTGFDKLMAVYGKTFLPSMQKCVPEDLNRRTTSGDRRSSDLKQRLRVGFHLSYTRAVSLGTFNMCKLVSETLAEEAVKYRYIDKQGQEIKPKQVLKQITGIVYEQATEQEKGNIPLIIENISQRILQEYIVSFKDRRKGK